MRGSMGARGGHRTATRLGLVAVFVLIGGKAAWNAVFQPTGPVPPGYATVAPAGDWLELKWGELHKGRWEQGRKPRVLPEVTACTGKTARLKGFLLPLHEAAEGSQFFLAKNPGGCYFCNPPGVHEVVMVSVKGDRKLPQTNLPVTVFGTFKAATGSPDDESLYVLKDATLAVIR